MTACRKIHVFQLVEGFGRGGAEKKLLELIQHMDNTRFRFTICSLDMGGRELEADFRKTGAKTIILTRKSRIDLGLIPQILKMIREYRVDVIMTTLYYADVLGQLVGALSGVRSVRWSGMKQSL